MELVELTEKEFKNFAYHHEQASFLQTIGWGKLKEKNGWKYELLGFKEEGKVIAATMLLSKMTPIKRKMFYAPHGFLLDYHNFSLLDNFVLKMKAYVKKNGGIFFKIDPYVMLIERDIDGKVVTGGIDNTSIYKHLKKLGFREINGKVTEQTLQGKWIYWLDINGKSMDEIMTQKIRLVIHQNEKNGVYVREGSYEELDKFKAIMEHTSKRREFISRSLAYYQELYQSLHQEGICKLYFAELNLKEQLVICKNEKEKLDLEYSTKEQEFQEGKIKVNEKKFRVRQNELKNALTKLNINIEEYEQLTEKHGDILVLGGILYMIHGKEVLSWLGGAYSDYLKLQPFYSIHYEMIKYAVENHYRYYNFYGISGDFRETSPMYGVYQMKRGFGGNVVELMGEFDYPVNKPFYAFYRISYWIVHKLKKLKTKL